jgi:hypothetical protein
VPEIKSVIEAKSVWHLTNHVVMKLSSINPGPVSPIQKRPALLHPTKPAVVPHQPTPAPSRPSQPGYYLLRLRLQYSNKAIRPLARIP